MFACKVKQNLIFLILQIIFLQKYVRHDIWIMAKDKMPIALDIKKIIVFDETLVKEKLLSYLLFIRNKLWQTVY